MFFDTERPRFHPRLTEFQAVVLAGYGNRYTPSPLCDRDRLNVLTEDDNVPKALLPVANRPVICHVLDWLDKANIQDVIVVAHGAAGTRISHTIRSLYTGPANVDVIILSRECEGSADALRQVKHHIKHDFILMGCDLITEMDPYPLLDMHRLNDASLTACLYTPVWESGMEPKDNNYGLYACTDTNGRLLMLKQRIRGQEAVHVRMSMLQQFPRVKMHTQLQDAHVYMCKRWVVDVVVNNVKLQSFREDVVPLMAKAQYKRGYGERHGLTTISKQSTSVSQSMAVDMSTTYDDVTSDTLQSEPRIYAYVIPSTYYTTRTNTVLTYSEANRHVTKNLTVARVHRTAELSAKTQVGLDSLVGESSRIDERCLVKKSVIGAHVMVGKNVKITNSIIMDNTVIEDNVKLDGCVVCQAVRIQEKASLKDCTLGANVAIVKETSAKNEQFGRDD
jgi:translation initiation factor eIF-2B subunit gamma